MRTFAGSLLALLAGASQAALNDLYPGDYIPAPAGQSAFVAYLYDRSLEGPYAKSQNTARKDRSAQTLILLGAQYFDLGLFRANVAVSGGRSHQSTHDRSTLATDRVSGFTDPKLSATLWPYRDEERARYLALNLAYVFGSGSYDSAASQNIGQNRDRSIFSLAWAGRTSELTMLEVTGEVARFGTNANLGGARLDQRTATAVTGFFRYRMTEQLAPYVGMQRNWGGELVIDGIAQSDSVRSDRFYLGLRLQHDPQHIFHLRLAADRDVEWGYGLRREWVLRWTWLPK